MNELSSFYKSKIYNQYFEDMKCLGVQMPDLVTRVTEFISEIISYISELIENGLAYESNGSVYFSTQSFERSGHKYGKLMPEQIGNSELLAEGEGALAANGDKKNPSDFVLWKRSKEVKDGVSEPSWQSPWGDGRPGWHIECSVMSSFALEKLGTHGNGLDIHAGGNDLKFPHHENEIAQSEAFNRSDQWVNYWLHAGHLNIKGFKMSKSLKNFITIRQALEVHSARQIRFCFLLHKYNSPMDYGDGTMTQAANIEKSFVEFFHNVKAFWRRQGISVNQHISGDEHEILQSLENTKFCVKAALADDFDTPKALVSLLDMIRLTNCCFEQPNFSSVVILNVAKYITSVLSTFGFIDHLDEIGFPLETFSDDSGVQTKEQLVAPYLDAFTAFRESVRIAAMNGDIRAVLAATDNLRDNVLPDLGVRMEDKGSGKDVLTVWKLDDPEVLKLEKNQREEMKVAKEVAKVEKEKKEKEKLEKSKIPPSELFLRDVHLYSAFDIDGFPKKDINGNPLSKGLIKKLAKEYERQTLLHNKFLETLSASSI